VHAEDEKELERETMTMKEEVIAKLMDYLQRTEDFALQEIPEVITQALRYEKINGWATASLMMVLILCLSVTAFLFYKFPSLDKYGDRTFLSEWGMFLPLIVVPIFFVQLCMSVDKLIKIYCAPKYYLIELIRSL
jgi:hypothetical protein